MPEQATQQWGPRQPAGEPARRGGSHRFSDANLPPVAEGSRQPSLASQVPILCHSMRPGLFDDGGHRITPVPACSRRRGCAPEQSDDVMRPASVMDSSSSHRRLCVCRTRI